VEKRSVGNDRIALRIGHPVLRQKDKIIGLAPAFEQILERLADRSFPPAPRCLAHPIKVGAVFVDQLAAQTFIPFAPVSARNPPPRSSGKPVPLCCQVRVLPSLKTPSNEARTQP
jgi:hypothetical protein